MRIPDDVLLYMARLVQSNIRTLEGALVKLIAYASLENSPVTTQLAANILERYFITVGGGAAVGSSGEGGLLTPPSRAGVITPEAVRQVVARKFHLPPEALNGKKRDRDTAQARQIAMHLVRELTEVSLPGIGHFFGGRDHSTVAHACDRIRAQIPFDDDLRTLVEELLEELRTEAAG